MPQIIMSEEFMAKAKSAKSFEELRSMVAAEGIEIADGELMAKWEEFSNGAKRLKLSEEELDNVAGGCGDDENHEVYGGWAPCEHYSKEVSSYGGRSTDRCALCWYFHARSGDPGARDQAGDCYYRD